MRAYFSEILGERIVLSIRNDVFESIMKKDIEFFDKNKTGDLCKNIIK